ncbi:MAG: hypothetical protein H6940_05280 [Burkholderiales bacterium]|nr:hypothetical protein [Nitrospira sp.]MCP5242835.1 hypothetical protein [Burkholderiales bacterium]
MNKKEFSKALNIVRKSIHRIDPYSLLAGGSPDDEFDSEINAITSQLQRCGSGKDVADAIARVLNSSFSEKHNPEEYEEEGNCIYKALVENGLK